MMDWLDVMMCIDGIDDERMAGLHCCWNEKQMMELMLIDAVYFEINVERLEHDNQVPEL
jgi:hypothetical protein